MNSFSQLNSVSSTSVTFTDQADTVIVFGSTLGSTTISRPTQFVLPQRVPLTTAQDLVTDIVVQYTAPNPNQISSISYTGSNPNIFVNTNSSNQWQVRGIRTVSDYNEAFANVQVAMDLQNYTSFVLSTEVTDQYSNIIDYSITCQTPFVVPAAVSYAEDTPQPFVIAIADVDQSGNTYQCSVSVSPVGNLRIGASGNGDPSLSFTANTQSVVNSIMANLQYVPTLNSVASATILYNQTRVGDSLVQAANVAIPVTNPTGDLYDPVLTGGFYLLDSSGNNTGNVIVTDVYYNQLPYFDIIAEGSTANVLDHVDSLTMSAVSSPGTGPVLPYFTGNLSVPAEDLGNRAQSYYKSVGFGVAALGGENLQNFTVTAETVRGQVTQQLFPMRTYSDYFTWSTYQTNWVPQNVFSALPNARGSGFNGNITGTIAGGTWTSVNKVDPFYISTRHYPQFAFSEKNIIGAKITWQILAASGRLLSYNLQSGEIIGSPTSASITSYTASSWTIQINSTTWLAKTAGSLHPTTIPSPVSRQLTTLTQTVHGAEETQIGFTIGCQVAVPSTLLTDSGDRVVLQISFEGPQSYAIQGTVYGPNYTPVLNHTTSGGVSLVTRWNRG